MPVVTVSVGGGEDQENLISVTIGNWIWGGPDPAAVPFGASQNVPAAAGLAVVALYKDDRFFRGNTNIPNQAALQIEVIANGPPPATTIFILT